MPDDALRRSGVDAFGWTARRSHRGPTAGRAIPNSPATALLGSPRHLAPKCPHVCRRRARRMVASGTACQPLYAPGAAVQRLSIAAFFDAILDLRTRERLGARAAMDALCPAAPDVLPDRGSPIQRAGRNGRLEFAPPPGEGRASPQPTQHRRKTKRRTGGYPASGGASFHAHRFVTAVPMGALLHSVGRRVAMLSAHVIMVVIAAMVGSGGRAEEGDGGGKGGRDRVGSVPFCSRLRSDVRARVASCDVRRGEEGLKHGRVGRGRNGFRQTTARSKRPYRRHRSHLAPVVKRLRFRCWGGIFVELRHLGVVTIARRRGRGLHENVFVHPPSHPVFHHSLREVQEAWMALSLLGGGLSKASDVSRGFYLLHLALHTHELVL